MAEPTKDTPLEIAAKLEGQVDEILSLYDLGERLHPYEKVHGERVLNEDQRRQNMVSFLNQRGTSGSIMRNCTLFGFAALYVYSRRGAANPLDMSRLRACGWTSLSVFMLGSTFGCMYGIEREKMNLKNASQNVITSTRVSQNEQTHALLRTMKFHLTTRQMSLWDQDPR